MKKLSVKDLISFRNKSDRSKQNFANNIKIEKREVPTEGGGDYWVTCLSAINNNYKLNDLQSILDKKNELEEKLELSENTKTKNMYKRNIKILENYENFDFTRLKPKSDLNFQRKKKNNYILEVKGISLQAKPSYVFSFDNSGVQEIGAIWFIAKLNGFKIDELGMFADVLHKYLNTHFSQQWVVSSEHCIAVDVFNNLEVNYLQLENDEIPKILDSTLTAIKALM